MPAAERDSMRTDARDCFARRFEINRATDSLLRVLGESGSLDENHHRARAFLPVPPVMGGAVEKVWFALGQEFARRGHEVVLVSRALSGAGRSENECWLSSICACAASIRRVRYSG